MACRHAARSPSCCLQPPHRPRHHPACPCCLDRVLSAAKGQAHKQGGCRAAPCSAYAVKGLFWLAGCIAPGMHIWGTHWDNGILDHGSGVPSCIAMRIAMGWITPPCLTRSLSEF
eukprot:scaffold81520_cov17-Tisochrysis_lutea.AAC.2